MKIVSLKCTNFRTLESLSLDFHHSFAAICGPNDSGKTNVIRAIRAFVQEDNDRFPFGDSTELSVKDDFPKWNDSHIDSRCVSLTAKFQIFRDRDAGLYQSIVKQLSLESPDDMIEVTITLANSAERVGREVQVEVGSKQYPELDSQQVLNRIQSAKCVVFHNSTQSPPRIYFQGTIGLSAIRDLTIEDEKVMANIKGTVNKGLAKIAKGRQREFEALLGKLEQHYKVGLSLPSFDFTHLPFSITLGETKFEVPLDDWGSGTRNRTQILLALFMAKKVSEAEESAKKTTPIIIIEEPECFLHPSAQAEFGRVIRDLAQEFQVQVILTTHSPYMLSLTQPESNILLKRKTSRKQPRETIRVDTAGDNWMQPFAEALGLESEEFEPWKKLFLGRGQSILLVEGDIDKEYFDLLRQESHGVKRLDFDGEIIPYDGIGALENQTLLRFIKNRYSRVFVTFDLDVAIKVEKTLQKLGFEKGKGYLPLGKDSAGRRDIEGMLPDSIKATVRQRVPELVDAASGASGDEQKSARNQLKRLYLDEFKSKCKPTDEFFGAFYPVVAIANKCLQHEE